MLVELRVRDLAVIADARLELAAGLNVLTGETGAGKSLLVDALSLLLGERAESDLVRRGASRAIVEGAFETDARTHGRTDARTHGRTDAQGVLDRLGIEPEDGRLILKREVQATGRSRAWVNGSPVTIGVLAELGALLVDLHGQHDNQSLLRPEAQRDILDAFAEADADAGAVGAAWDERARLLAERESIATRQAEARKRADYLRHVAGEIGRAAPKAGELESLEDEAKRLGHAEELGRTAGELADVLGSDDGSASHLLAQAGRLLAALERIDERGSAGWREMLETALFNAQELERAARDYAESLELDPARLAAVEARRDVLFRLDQKYGPGMDRVLAAAAEARAELDLLDTAETDLRDLSARLAQAERDLHERCKALSARRRSAAKRLGNAVSKQLRGLGMPDGSLRVSLEPLDQPGRHGAESVEFLCALNPGMGERPVARAASGGELSRLMLALKVELARHDRVPTLVFDEVDAGIGGHVADRVAEALSRVAQGHQVLVITHLPQIAAAASRHNVVAKGSADGIAQSDVQTVHGEDRVEEIARMMGGAQATARRHAQELLRADGAPA